MDLSLPSALLFLWTNVINHFTKSILYRIPYWMARENFSEALFPVSGHQRAQPFLLHRENFFV
ncbi:hypothetical protein Ga0058931_0649 [Roseibaca calidilacus]|uniref:Uncharacterized protein n=1 Tax=Roseibaca calidilacus TaxID=1666912 RepID=A0ABM9VQU4_9RHOB|nr:hypothetical protein Ga0058931_0649 [Roseibaca calidilacus]